MDGADIIMENTLLVEREREREIRNSRNDSLRLKKKKKEERKKREKKKLGLYRFGRRSRGTRTKIHFAGK